VDIWLCNARIAHGGHHPTVTVLEQLFEMCNKFVAVRCRKAVDSGWVNNLQVVHKDLFKLDLLAFPADVEKSAFFRVRLARFCQHIKQ
jgi:hypothetical protein